MRPLAWGLTAALVATLAANAFYLTMSFYYFFVFALLVVAAPAVFAPRLRRVKVVVLTTSYPRDAEDVGGRVRPRAVEQLRLAGVEVEVVSPASFRHFGIAYGDGIVGNLRRAPWQVVLLPLVPVRFARAARAAARGRRSRPCPLAAVGPRRAGDAEAARRPALGHRRRARPAGAAGSSGPILRRARLVLGASRALADAARELGAATCGWSRAVSTIPEPVGAPDEPPHVLYVGRLSRRRACSSWSRRRRACRSSSSATGRCATACPDAVGFVPPAEVGAYFERAAVVACPSRREGYGVVARQAMAYGRPVVATRSAGCRRGRRRRDRAARAAGRRRRSALGARAAARRPRAARAARCRRPRSAQVMFARDTETSALLHLYAEITAG